MKPVVLALSLTAAVRPLPAPPVLPPAGSFVPLVPPWAAPSFQPRLSPPPGVHPLVPPLPSPGPVTAGTAAEAAVEAAREEVRAVRALRLRSPSRIQMIIDSIEPGSRREKLLPRLRAYYEESLRDLLALRTEFSGEFVWGRELTIARLAAKLAELTARYGVGNCNEQAFLVQAALRERGVEAHLVALEVFDYLTQSKDPKRNHVFVVFGTPPGSNPAMPDAWGPDAVIADPWLGTVGPAGPALERMLTDVFRVDRSHEGVWYHAIDYEHL